MKLDRFVREFEHEFYSRLDAKTSWGRNEIKEVFKDALISVLVMLKEVE